jgi:hypothetical protein
MGFRFYKFVNKNDFRDIYTIPFIRHTYFYMCTRKTVRLNSATYQGYLPGSNE